MVYQFYCFVCLLRSIFVTVVEVDSEGHIVNIFYLYAGQSKKTPGVKCIIQQQNHLYVGCSDGGVYGKLK